MYFMKVILCISALLIAPIIANGNEKSAEETCVDENPEILLDLGGSPKPEKIIYSTYDACSQSHDYCGSQGCSLEVFDDKGEYALGYIIDDQWYVRPVSVLGEKPTFELVVPLKNGDLRIISVIKGKITETVIKD